VNRIETLALVRLEKEELNRDGFKRIFECYAQRVGIGVLGEELGAREREFGFVTSANFQSRRE